MRTNQTHNLRLATVHDRRFGSLPGPNGEENKIQSEPKRFSVTRIETSSLGWTPNTQGFSLLLPLPCDFRFEILNRDRRILVAANSPRSRRICRASSQKTTANALLPLLFVGITKSTPANSLSVLHKATIGMPTFEASLTACASARGSETTMTSGSTRFGYSGFDSCPGMNLPISGVAPVSLQNFLMGS